MTSKFLLGLALAAIVAPAAMAQATLDVCVLANTELPSSLPIADGAKAEYKRKMAAECALSEKYQQMQFKARQKWNLSLEQIAEYQALRYIRRSDYEVAKQNGTPVPLTYQLLKSDYLKENSQKSSIVWDGFLVGIQQLGPERQRVVSGGQLGISNIETYHREFYRLSLEEGDYSNTPYPGVMKAPGLADRHWWRLKSEEVESTRSIVRQMNEGFAEAGLLPSGMERLQVEPYQADVLSVRPLADGSGYGIYSGESRANRNHLARLFEFVNHSLSQARRGQHILWNERLFTPGEVAWLSQQFFVAVHPFSEGNGRVSRLLQEILLTTFNLPHGSSGDMMQDDVLTPPAAYYRVGIQSTQALLVSVDRCLESTYPTAVTAKKTGAKNEEKSPKPQMNLLDVPASEIEYGCRILR